MFRVDGNVMVKSDPRALVYGPTGKRTTRENLGYKGSKEQAVEVASSGPQFAYIDEHGTEIMGVRGKGSALVV